VIKSAYERLFAAFYGWSLKVDGRRGISNVYYASISLSLALMLSAVSVAMIIDMVTPEPFLLHLVRTSRAWLILGYLSLTVLQYLYFRRRNHYRAVIVAHGPTEDSLANGPHWKVIAYMVLSVLAVVGLLVLGLN
jgi:hypothetical protein